jgi:hypothetical protein
MSCQPSLFGTHNIVVVISKIEKEIRRRVDNEGAHLIVNESAIDGKTERTA